MEYETVIGLEVHAQLATHTKIFCGCRADFGAPTNTQTCPVCLGMPGALPVLNRRVVDFALRVVLATGGRVAPVSRFARKNYFYPDLPKGYQISQYELPLAEGGFLEFPFEDKIRRIRITRIHLEEDAGKLTHGETPGDRDFSFVDFNRTGVPLIEIVSEPDFRSPGEAAEYLRRLRQLVRYLGVCDGNMERGSLRCDANVSVRPAGSDGMGTKTEIKNLNSFRNVQRALEHEAGRQIEVLEHGGRIVQETRLWDPAQSVTLPMRSKEEAHDYRYFPEPDLMPLEVDERWLERVRDSLPELPLPRRSRLMEQYALSEYDAEQLTASRELADYFEEVARLCPDAKKAANWILSEMLREVKAGNEEDFTGGPVAPDHLAAMLSMIEEGTISGKIAKTVFEEMYRTGRPPEDIVRERGLTQVSDREAIEAAARRVLEAHPKQAEKYRAGKEKLFGFFVGQVMKETGGRANPGMVNEVLRELLNS